MEEVKKTISIACKKLFSTDNEVEIEYCDPRFGDFMTNIAMKLSKKNGKPPREIAETILQSIDMKSIAKKEVAGPGFINITMTDEFWAKQLDIIDRNYLLSDVGKGKKVQVEFISANPTGPLTLANGRGGYSGDVLSNVMRISGYQTESEYYVNDAGNQIEVLVNSVINYEKNKSKSVKTEQANNYSGEYVGEVYNRLKSKLNLDAKGVLGTDEIKDKVVADILENYIKPSIEKMGISFDNWFSEKENLYKNNAQLIKEVLSALDKSNQMEKRDGALWLKGEEDSRERVLVKSDGNYTYLLADLAYHQDKFVERRFDRVINLWGADHAGQIKSLQDGIRALGIEKTLDVIIFQLVRLIKDGKEFKMSKRAGNYVTIDELLEMIEPDIVRWFFLSRDFNTHVDFDLNLAAEQSQKNPYHYVMYSYTRARSIITKSKDKGLKASNSISVLTAQEKALIKQLCRLQLLIKQISASYEVHRLTFYGYDLAKAFHDYYERERVIELSPEKAAPKLYLINKFIEAFETYSKVLGITPRHSM